MSVCTNLYFNERVSSCATIVTGATLALEAKHLPICNTFGHSQVKDAALGERHALLGSNDRFKKINFKCVAQILPLCSKPVCARTGAPGARPILPEDV